MLRGSEGITVENVKRVESEVRSILFSRATPTASKTLFKYADGHYEVWESGKIIIGTPYIDIAVSLYNETGV